MSVSAKQSTTRTVIVGPILDSSGAAVTGAAVGDLKISKNGGAPAGLDGSATLTHRHTGYYSLALTASDLDTVGQAEVVIDKTTDAMPVKVITVMPAHIYDFLFTDGTGVELALKKLTIANSAGSALVLTSSGGNGHGLATTGHGTGRGVNAQGGDSSGDGIRATAGAGNAHGLSGFGTGIGAGVAGFGGASGGVGLGGHGGPGGDGIHGQGGDDSLGLAGHGILGEGGEGGGYGLAGTGDGAGPGAYFEGGATGPGLVARGGATSGNGILADTQGGNSHGIQALASGSANGIDAQADTTGHGLATQGGSTSGHGYMALAPADGVGLYGISMGGYAGISGEAYAPDADGILAYADDGGQGLAAPEIDAIYNRLGVPAGASVSADVAAVKADTAASKTVTDLLEPFVDGSEFLPVDAHKQNFSVIGTSLTTKKPDGTTDTAYSPKTVTTDPSAEPITGAS